MKLSLTTLITAFLCVPATLLAYPATPDTWTWKYHEDGYFVPLQISAATDEDGRLRTLFLDDSQPSYYSDGTTHRVAPPVMQSFRAFPDGTVLNEYRGLTVDDYTNSSKKATLASYNAALEPRRTCVYSAKGDETTFAAGGAYRRLLPSESFGAGRSVSHKNHFIGVANRPVVDNATYEDSVSDTLAIAATSTRQNLPTILNEATLEVRSVTGTTPDLAIRYSQTTSTGFNSVFLRVLADGTPAGWSTNRVFTGGALAMTSDRRDFYAFVTSYKFLSPGGQLATEARVFRLRTLGNTTDPIIGIESVTTNVVAESTLPAGTPATSALVYPQIAVPGTDEPTWVVWGNPATNKIHAMKRVPGTTGTAEENSRTIGNGYVGAFGVADGGIATGTGPSIAIDALNILHFTYRSGSYAVYGRENTNGSAFVSVALAGVCSGAPAVAVGPGRYAYVVYRGTKPGSPNSFDKLVVAYPTGLEAAYKGDFEDRDKDGRIGLMERIQGTSDTSVETGTNQSSLSPVPRIVEIAPSDRRLELSFRLDRNSVRQGTTDVWNLADGADTLEVRPADGNSPAGPFFTGGYTVTDDFTTSSARFVTVRYPTAVGPSPAVPSKFFIFKVRRIAGPP
jgi:hypothetical protein